MNNRSRSWFMYGVVAFIVFFGAYTTLYRQKSSLDTVFSLVMYPLLKIQQSVTYPFRCFLQFLSEQRESHALITLLKQEKHDLLQKLIQAHSLLFYMENTQELIDAKKRYGYNNGILCHIVYRECSDQRHSVLVDRGERHGITTTMVAVYHHCLVGRVIEVFPYYSKVILMTDPACNIAAYATATKALGIVQGNCSTEHLIFNYVNHLSQIKKDDLVISSGEGLLFPQGFGLGTVEQISPGGMHYAIKLKPLLDVRNIDYCYLIQKGNE